MSASNELAVLCGLLACGGVLMAQEAEAPDLEFLEYLGSWEESDEDWILFSEEKVTDKAESDVSVSKTDAAPQEEKVAELDDEN